MSHFSLYWHLQLADPYSKVYVILLVKQNLLFQGNSVSSYFCLFVSFISLVYSMCYSSLYVVACFLLPLQSPSEVELALNKCFLEDSYSPY